MCLDAREVLGWWTLDPVSLAAPLLSSVVYGAGLRRLWRTVGTGHGIQRWEAAAFVAGQLTLLVALVSPVDRLSDLLFSAHMTQHEILLVVAPPLVVLGRPLVALAWALPPRGRRALIKVRWRRLSPLLVLLLHGAVIWLWHLPAAFELTLRDEGVHALQHATFFGTAALFWWTIVRGRYGRAGYGMAVLFVFATATHTSILGVLFTVGTRVVYPLYASRATAIDIDPVADQQLAGLVMWIPAGTILVLAALALFVAWLGEAGRRVAAAERKRLARPAQTGAR